MAKTKDSSGTRILAIVLVTFLIIGLVAVAVILPKSNSLSESKATIAALDSEETVLQTQIVDLTAKMGEIEDQSVVVGEFAAKFPGSAEQENMFSDIQFAAASANATVTSIVPMTPTLGNEEGVEGADPALGVVEDPLVGATGDVYPLASIPLTITANGDWNSLRTFLATLETLDRAVLVESVTYNENAMTVVGRQFIVREMTPLDQILVQQDSEGAGGSLEEEPIAP